MKPKLLLSLALVLSGGLFGCSEGKSNERIESVKLPSGEVLENHTYLKSGWGSDRYNTLFLKNPATGASEQINDRYGYLNYEAGPNDPSLLQRYPLPHEFIYGNVKVLVIGSYLCERIKFHNVPDWNITSIVPEGEAEDYLKTFLPTNNIFYKSRDEMGLQGSVPFLLDSLDLTNKILTLKKQIPKGNEDWLHSQHSKKRFHDPIWDEFPPYLVYSAIDFKGGAIHQFPLKFDIARTKAKNGPLWDNTMPPDISSITIQSAGFGSQQKIANVTARVVELLHTNTNGFPVNAETLGCDPFPGRNKNLTIKYMFKDFNFTSTNSSRENVSYKTLINDARN